MHKIGKLFENGLKTTLCFSTSNLPNFYIFWVPNVVKKCKKKNNNEEHRLRPAGVSKASMTYIYLESQKHKNFWSNP